MRRARIGEGKEHDRIGNSFGISTVIESVGVLGEVDRNPLLFSLRPWKVGGGFLKLISSHSVLQCSGYAQSETRLRLSSFFVVNQLS